MYGKEFVILHSNKTNMGRTKQLLADDRYNDLQDDRMDDAYFYDLYCDANGQCYSDADSGL